MSDFLQNERTEENSDGIELIPLSSKELSEEDRCSATNFKSM